MANGGENGNGNGEPASTKYLRTRIVLGAIIVALGLGAVVWSLDLVLDNYDVKGTTPPATGGAAANATATSPSDVASVSASSVVAVLTPVMAGILGIVGLYFTVSSTGSARGRQAEVDQTTAETQAKMIAALPDATEAIKEQAEASKQLADAAKEAAAAAHEAVKKTDQ